MHKSVSRWLLIVVAAAVAQCSAGPTPPPPQGPPNDAGPCVPGFAGFTSVHEFALQPYSFPEGIAAGPDGNVWFTESYSNKVGRITHQGAITEFSIQPNSYPFGIVLGPDGNLWFVEASANKIGVMTPAGGLIAEYAIPTATSGSSYITKGPDGNLWFTEVNANKIGRLTPGGSFAEFPLPGLYNSGPQQITSGPDGNVWFTYDSDPYSVLRITPSGTITTFPIPKIFATVGNQQVPIAMLPNGIVTGPTGHLWVANTAGIISELTPSGTFVNMYSVSAGGSGAPWGIAAPADGRIYFTTLGSAIGWVQRGGSFGYYPTPSARSESTGIVVGPDGNLWFAETHAQKIGCLAPLHY